MKKTILLGSAILILAASAAAFVFAARHSNSSDSLVNANIEALSNGESGFGDKWFVEYGVDYVICTPGGGKDCPGEYV